MFFRIWNRHFYRKMLNLSKTCILWQETWNTIIHLLQQKFKCENVFVAEGYLLYKEVLQCILTGELSAQVIKGAINMFAYLPWQFYYVHRATSQASSIKSDLDRHQAGRVDLPALHTKNRKSSFLSAEFTWNPPKNWPIPFSL